MDVQELYDAGHRHAAGGGRYQDNPYRSGHDSWIALAWYHGFLAGRTPDPACPCCCGSGLATLRSVGEPCEYDGTQVPCPCNLADHVEQSAESDPPPDRPHD
jgi:hypothetical protein